MDDSVSPARSVVEARGRSSPGARAASHELTAAWWHEAVIYHIYLPSFRDANGDGVGDLAGVIDSLPYIDNVLGVDALWISPFFMSPWIDGGYDIADHTAVEPRFGDLATFDRLVAESHRRGIRVIIDYVPNHTSDQHPWFAESRSSRDNPKRDWYLWADAAPGKPYPNNWVSEAGGSVWEHDQRTGQFYLHSHLVEQPDLSWRNPDLRRAMLDVLRFWLERGVDGFRIDVAHMLMKDPELRDNPPNPLGEQNPYDRQHPDFHAQLHVHDRRHPDLHQVLREIRGVLDEYGDRIAIGELDVMPWCEWAAYYGDDLDELHLPLNFRLIETPWDARSVRAALAELEAALPAGAWAVINLGNHDRSRIASRYGDAGARMAAMVLLTSRGSPLLYYGDELGMLDVDVPRERQRDGFARRDGGPTRDPNRTPMQWSCSAHAGFTEGSDQPWLPLADDWHERNVNRELNDPHSMLALYRRLLALRRRRRVLRAGSMLLVDSAPPDCLRYQRVLGADAVTVILNFASSAREAVLTDGPVQVLASTDSRRSTAVVATDVLGLAPHEGVVLEQVRD